MNFLGRRRYSIIPLILLSVLMTGCEMRDAAELDLLKRDDSAFKNTMEIKDGISSEIQSLKDQMKTKKNQLEKKVSQLKSEYQAEIQTRKQQISKLNDAIAVTHDKFKTQYDEEAATLEAKEKKYNAVLAAYNNAKQVISTKDTLGLGLQEVGEWQARMAAYKRDSDILKDEISSLKSRVELQKKKLKYL